MSHFTYREPNNSDLKQGDLLLKTDKIVEILKEVHPHYLKDDYKYFLVLTQSCDLVRREQDKCKAKYISIAAIRPFELLLEREILKYQKTNEERIGKICDINNKFLLHRYLSNLFNNNNSEYFFLKQDLSRQFNGDHVAFLRLSIALKADMHYEVLLKAKILELENEFKAKLGWLVGNIYSRVGTPDWVPDEMSKSEFENMIDEILDRNVLWINKKQIKGIVNKIKEENIAELTEDLIKDIAEHIKIETVKDIFSKRLERLISPETTPMDQNCCKKLINILLNDSTISSTIKQ